MTWRDKMEIGLKKDAPFRRDNLPESEVEGPERAAGPGRSPVVVDARRRAATKARRVRGRTTTTKTKTKAKAKSRSGR